MLSVRITIITEEVVIWGPRILVKWHNQWFGTIRSRFDSWGSDLEVWLRGLKRRSGKSLTALKAVRRFESCNFRFSNLYLSMNFLDLIEPLPKHLQDAILSRKATRRTTQAQAFGSVCEQYNSKTGRWCLIPAAQSVLEKLPIIPCKSSKGTRFRFPDRSSLTWFDSYGVSYWDHL